MCAAQSNTGGGGVTIHAKSEGIKSSLEAALLIVEDDQSRDYRERKEDKHKGQCLQQAERSKTLITPPFPPSAVFCVISLFSILSSTVVFVPQTQYHCNHNCWNSFRSISQLHSGPHQKPITHAHIQQFFLPSAPYILKPAWPLNLFHARESSSACRGGRAACVYHLRAGLALQMGCKIQFVCVETTPISLPQNIRAAN